MPELKITVDGQPIVSTEVEEVQVLQKRDGSIKLKAKEAPRITIKNECPVDGITKTMVDGMLQGLTGGAAYIPNIAD